MNQAAATSKARPPRSRSGDRRQPRKKTKISATGIYLRAIKDAFVKLNPQHAIKNPVMFLVWVGTLITLVVTIDPSLFGPVQQNNPQLFNGILTGILFFTVWFANFAEAVAEGRGKAQADALRSTKSETTAKQLATDGTITEVPSSSLKQGDTVYVVAGDFIPADGEVIMGVASVDESAITGESAPVLKESGSDVASSVTGGTRIISDELIIRITAESGKGFIDRMIALVEGAERSKTPNEIALTVLLAVLSLVFLFVVVTLPAFAYTVKNPVSIPVLIALLVALIPTTIGGLLSAIGIAGMDRVAQFNVIATSGKAVEACGDVNTLVLDKTGTITLGNRLAEEFIPINGHTLEDIANVAWVASVFDDTPEGKSIVRLAEKLGARVDFDYNQAQAVEFSAKTRMSGTNLPGGREVRKGAVGAIKGFVRSRNGRETPELDAAYERVSQQGGTPLAVCLDHEIYGVIYLKDIVKPGIRERFDQLRRMGVRTIMLTGDNHITAAVIAKEAGVDDFIAEATPEDKITVIKQEQAKGKLVAMTGDGTNDAPALAQANVGLAMNTGTQAAKEAANMVDLDSDPTKLIDIVSVGKQLLITRGALTTFSLANDIAKYFAIIPIIFASANLQSLNIMKLTSTNSAVLSALIYNALIIPALIPLALKGVNFRPLTANQLLQRNILIYGLGGIITPFIAIKIIDILITLAGLT
ncbi:MULTISPECIES: potassium-transporting ATPase subunit KdpB [unclassified Tolypothrix]|uniref:potassium-transporting ATPase subunit KdpB n=1 Tax=unclassified Tolypothrix TaxID=2649714 RepID=UPI0005EAAC3A|nr:MULTISPECIES: potassium-transporting ATPase subunit KdpB [unclassified Tolypothrix]BAY93006.1 potassium-dependent ATPase subunit B [Microchaete diplosiphon NIES-3275]EKF02702.1 K+-transporting ATPase, B subunit [Tolypothrix sp. PCC 7601]MBE9087149.1 potassium-transporting ATPase subunit KdpB [Tolypothrix sp. LEGE 11397]UYD26900.1 potassium-transporting ATPase subunit KdpB [Tolypothrix sp. PCC 7712]UYD37240.1 potassium-transporting ATPase subunit KdpB [Tolypothrix sp. PCC 7601]